MRRRAAQDRASRDVGFEVVGPFDVGRHGPTRQPREDLHVPARTSRGRKALRARILATLARKAFRRPVTDADLAGADAFYAEGRAKGTFESGIQKA